MRLKIAFPTCTRYRGAHLGALRKLARLAMKRGNDAQTRQCFERILQLHPGDLQAQQSLRNLDALGTIKKGFTT